MSGAFEVRYNLDEQIAAYWLFLRNRWLWKRALRYVAVLGTIVFLIASSGAVRDHGLDPLRLAVCALVGLMAGCLGLAVLASYVRWNVPRLVRRSFEQLGLDGRSTRYSFDGDRLQIEDDIAGAKLEWRELVGWDENEQFLMLYRTDFMFYYVPKRQVGPGILDAMKANLFAAAVPAI